MEIFKKFGLLVAAILCAALIISPVDVLSGIAVDDIVYIIGIISSIGKVRKISAKAA